MTATINETDIESIESLDFEFAPPCEHANRVCDNTAAWAVTMRCCGHVVLLCDPCTEYVREWDTQHDAITCRLCETSVLGPIVCNYRRL